MPRRVHVRDSDDADFARRQWVRKWKTHTLAELSPLTPRAVKVQLPIDLERALSRYRPDDDEGEIQDVVLGLVDEVNTRLAAALLTLAADPRYLGARPAPEVAAADPEGRIDIAGVDAPSESTYRTRQGA